MDYKDLNFDHIAGPAVVIFGGVSWYSENDIAVNIDVKTFQIGTSRHGIISRRKASLPVATISFKPDGQVTSGRATAAYPYTANSVGKSIFTTADVPLVIWGVDGAKYTFARAGQSQSPGMLLSAAATAWDGTLEFKAIHARAANPTTADNFLKAEADAFTDSTMDQTKVITPGFTAAYGTTPLDVIESQDGFKVTCPLSTTEVGCDRFGVVDILLGTVGPASCTFTPFGLTDTNWKALLDLDGTNFIMPGAGPAAGTDLVITGTGLFQPFDRSYSDTSWTLGANYQLTDGLGAFARYTDTSRLPSPSEFQGSTGDAVRTDIRITPVTMSEAGLKWQSDVIDLYATAFYTKFENVRFSDNVFNNATNSFTTRVGYADTKTIGLELEGIVRFAKFADVAATVSWQNPEYESFKFTENVGGAPVVRNFSGNQLIRVPEIGARVTPGLNLAGGAVRIEAPIEYYSDRFADAANSQKLPSYTVYNVNARWDVSDRFALSLAGVNLSNEIGLTEGNPRAGQFISGDAGARYFAARPILGRSWRAAATFRF
jgi:hypothetical protein